MPTIRNALKQTISNVTGLQVTDLTQAPNPPCAMVYPEPPFDLEIDFDGGDELHFAILILVPYVDVDNAQERLDAYISSEGPQSVLAQIVADNTFGGQVSSSVLDRLKSYGVIQFQDGGTQYLSAEITIRVWA